MSTPATHQLVENLFRRQSANIVSSLVAVFGPAHLQLAEDVTQETLLKALRLWPYRGIPDNPSAWLFTTAKNTAIDHLRRDSSFRHKTGQIANELNRILDSQPAPDSDMETLRDDTLRMMFVCAHPSLAENSHSPLILKTLCGFSIGEIAKAFLTNTDVIAQRLSRARKQLRKTNPDFDLTDDQISDRLPAVLNALYLMFSEGYGTNSSTLCMESLRLIEALLTNPVSSTGDTAALGSLCNLQAARLRARLDKQGALIPLEEQDRAKWDRDLLGRGFQLLKQSTKSEALSAYHLQAGIAANHAGAKSFAETDWERIVGYYDNLIELQPSPVFLLNRAVAVSFVDGIDSALDELGKLKNDTKMQSFYLFHATLADLHRRKLNTSGARSSYQTALDLTGDVAEQQFLKRRLAELQ